MTGVTAGAPGVRRALAVGLVLGLATGLALAAPGVPGASADVQPIPGSSAGTDSSGSLDQQAVQLRHQLAAAAGDLDEASAATRAARVALESAAGQLPPAQAALATAQGSLAGASAVADAARAQLAQAASAVRAGQVDLAAARARLEIRRAEVGAFARAAYETGPTGTIASWLAATSPGDVIDRQQALASVAARLHAQLLALAAARTDLVQQQGALEQRRAAVAAQAARLSAAEAQARSAAQAAVSATATVQGLVARRAFAVHQAQDALAGDQQRYEQLQASSQRIATLLAARQAAARKGAGTPGPGASGLLWPADGPMTSPYGMRVDPVTHRRTLHAGIDIGAADGSEIRAAQAGTVAFAGDETGYGNYTCIDHGGGFATCYAHQSAILVAVGQQVARGQVIGRVGSTGYSTGPHLHFETRVNGNPVDPMQYF